MYVHQIIIVGYIIKIKNVFEISFEVSLHNNFKYDIFINQRLL